MIIFLLGEDRSYLSWLSHHRNGFVLDWLRKPTNKKPMLHRANCPEIKKSQSKNTHWTTGRHVKVCSLDLDEVMAWANEESGHDAELCDACKPQDESATPGAGADRHLTKLGKEIVDYVVEVAVIHLDGQDADYKTTVADIAQCLDKTIKQLSPAVIRLATDGYVRLDQAAEDGVTLSESCKVFPTADAMRTLPAYQKVPEGKIEAEIESLTED